MNIRPEQITDIYVATGAAWSPGAGTVRVEDVAVQWEDDNGNPYSAPLTGTRYAFVFADKNGENVVPVDRVVAVHVAGSGG